MAVLIPENLRTRADVPAGVNRLARVLRDGLDDDATVWFEPLFDRTDTRPHLVILVPDAGVLIVDVLEAKADRVVGARETGLTVIVSGRARSTVEHPLARAEAFAARLRDLIAREGRLDDGERLPVSAAGVFAYITRAEAAAKKLTTNEGFGRCLFRDDLQAGVEDPASIRRLVGRLLDHDLRDPLAAKAEKVHRALIHPDTVIGSPQLPFPTVPEDELKVLDREQEALAKGLGEGHRVVRGVAGSGKTLVLTYRARLLAENFPNHVVLVTCFNRTLAGSLRQQLPLPNVEVATIDSLINRTCRSNWKEPPNDLAELDDRAQLALAILDEGGRRKWYDHVLIDEAQDFSTAALRVAIAHLRDGADSLLVVADAAQNIYRNKFTWKAAGINAPGRTRVLDRSYRNTKEILEFAHDFLLRGGDIRIDAGEEDETVVVPPKASVRRGKIPLLLRSDSPQHEVSAIAQHLRQRLDQGTPPDSMAILYGSKNAGVFWWTEPLRAALDRAGVPYFWVTDPDHGDNRDNLGRGAGRVTLSTIHSAKGLEWRHVVMCAFLDDKPEEDRVLNRRLLYVGMTRATEELVLSVSGNHPYIADLESSR